MPLIESRPVLYNGATPQRRNGVLVVDHAPVVDYSYSAGLWDETNKAMDRLLDRTNFQVLVLTPHRDDVTPLLIKDLSRNKLGPYSVASAVDQTFPDNEPNIRIRDGAPMAESLYVVSSIINPQDFVYLLGKLDHFKNTLNTRCITLITPYMMSTRQDKNVDRHGNFVPTPINIRALLGALAPFIDRMIVFEPHSSATQTYAAEWGLPLAPLSPWQFMFDSLQQRGIIVKEKDEEKRVAINHENSVIIRPDKGRNIAATRISQYAGIPSVCFNKTRLTGASVDIYELTPKEQEQVKGKICVMYDDEASTMGTINTIADALQKYGAVALAACLIHCKFTSGWEEKIQHPLLTTVLATDSREPVGNIRMTDKIEIVSLEPMIRQIIEADVRGVNYWTDTEYRSMILQPDGDEV